MADRRAAAERRPGWGGARPGAGRKPKGERAGVPHLRRAEVPPQSLVHAILRLRPGILHARSTAKAIAAATEAGKERPGFSLLRSAVKDDQVHLLVQADGARLLSKGIQGFSVRLARALNSALGRTSAVFADRYEARVLRSRADAEQAVPRA